MSVRITSHKDLIVWQKSIDLVEKIYNITRSFPKDELYGITSQIKRAAISIPSNIAEGSGRRSSKEFIQFLYISLGSAAELETQLIISKRLGFVNDITILESISEVSRMLIGLISSLKNKNDKNSNM